MSSLLSVSSSSLVDSIDGDHLLRSVTINNIHEFEEIVHNNAQRITKPTPPPLYYGIGPETKEFSVNHFLDEEFVEVSDCEGESSHNDFSSSKNTLACNCDYTSVSVIKRVFATEESYVCYLRDQLFKEPKDNTTLCFESKFECGNLYAAERVKTCECGMFTTWEGYPPVSYETESNSITLDGINRKKTLFEPWEQVYILFLEADSNSTSHSQWFLFAVDNMIPGTEYTFIFPNFVKRSSSYNHGMEILFADLNGDHEWQKAGYDIIYGPNKQYIEKKAHFLYSYSSLVFKVVFNKRSRFLVAQHYPYSYSKTQLFINRKIAEYNAYEPRDYLITAKTIQKTIMNNDIDILTITEREGEGIKPVKERPVLLILARIHPGETESSYIFEGMLNHFLSDEESAEALRENFIIKMIPMMNPDGVIIGNYRCNYEGIDLNRKWHMSSQLMTPEIYAVHQLLKELISENSKVEMFIDIHGHFKKSNIFAYSSEKCRYLEILGQNSMNFSLEDCQFGVGKGKEHTGRVECQSRYDIEQSICIEASFYRIQKEEGQTLISEALLRQVGVELAHNLFSLVKPELPEFEVDEELKISDCPIDYTFSDDSGEDVDIFRLKKGRQKFSYVNYIRKNIGVQLLTKEDTLKTNRQKRPPKIPKAEKGPGDDFFARMAEPMRAKSYPQKDDAEEEINCAKKVTANEEQDATNNLLRAKRPESSEAHAQPVRIIYERTFDLEQEKIAFERQFYRPRLPISQVQERQWSDAAKRAEAIKMIRSRGYDIIPQKFELD